MNLDFFNSDYVAVMITVFFVLLGLIFCLLHLIISYRVLLYDFM